MNKNMNLIAKGFVKSTIGPRDPQEKKAEDAASTPRWPAGHSTLRQQRPTR